MLRKPALPSLNAAASPAKPPPRIRTLSNRPLPQPNRSRARDSAETDPQQIPNAFEKSQRRIELRPSVRSRSMRHRNLRNHSPLEGDQQRHEPMGAREPRNGVPHFAAGDSEAAVDV